MRILIIWLIFWANIAVSQAPIKIEPIITGLNGPWSFGFLPNGQILITEKRGHLYLTNPIDGAKQRISGLPPIEAIGQGGLLDVLIPRDFASNREIFLTYVKRQSGGQGTALLRAELPFGSARLQNLVEIFEMKSGSSGGRHFGSRLAEAPDGSIFMTIGDRGDRPSAQDLLRENGSILRLTRDGKPVAQSPVNGSTIWSWGHRNPQGLAIDRQGRVFAIEHGARGGDEINLIERGNNYGWPIISYGRHYSGGQIGEGTSKPGLEQPLYYWDPSIAPSGLMIYSGRLWPQWEDHIFTGSLKFDQIVITNEFPNVLPAGNIQTQETQRVRDIREGPDGGIYFLNESDGILYRITPN